MDSKIPYNRYTLQTNGNVAIEVEEEVEDTSPIKALP